MRCRREQERAGADVGAHGMRLAKAQLGRMSTTNSPIRRGDIRSARPSDWPNPGRSTAASENCSDSCGHIRMNA